MEAELLPCPFCGKSPSIVTRDVEPQGDSWYGKKMATFVECECGCCLFDETFHDGFYDAEVRAPAAWNRRAQLPAIPPSVSVDEGLLAALKEVLAAVRATNRPPETVQQAEAGLACIRKAAAVANAAIQRAEASKANPNWCDGCSPDNCPGCEGQCATDPAKSAEHARAITKSLTANVADALRPYLQPNQKVIWREPFRWHDDNGVLPNHYEMYGLPHLAESFGYKLIEDCGCAGIIEKEQP